MYKDRSKDQGRALGKKSWKLEVGGKEIEDDDEDALIEKIA